jgi:hypothetical protein
MNKFAQILFLTVMSIGIANAQGEDPATELDQHADLEKGKSAFKETWIHPDADFTQYNKLYLWEAEFEYRDVGPAQSTSSTRMSTRKREFGISDADRQKFEEVVSEAFVKGVQKTKKFELVDEIEPDTLIMRGAALDIISLVPPQSTGRSDVYLSNIGEATLVLELIDADTGDVLGLVSERRKIQSGNGQMDMMTMPTSSVTVIAEVRRWAQRAGSKLASELDKAIAGK